MPFAEFTDEFGQVSAFVSPRIMQRGPDSCGIVCGRVRRPPFVDEFLEAGGVVGVAEPFSGKVCKLSNLFFGGGHCAKAPIGEQYSSDWFDTSATFLAKGCVLRGTERVCSISSSGRWFSGRPQVTPSPFLDPSGTTRIMGNALHHLLTRIRSVLVEVGDFPRGDAQAPLDRHGRPAIPVTKGVVAG